MLFHIFILIGANAYLL